MPTTGIGQKNCPHKKVKTERKIHHENGKEVVLDDCRVEFDRLSCAHCNTWLGDINLHLEPIPVAYC